MGNRRGGVWYLIFGKGPYMYTVALVFRVRFARNSFPPKHTATSRRVKLVTVFSGAPIPSFEESRTVAV